MKCIRGGLHVRFHCAWLLLAGFVTTASAEETVVTIAAGDGPALALTIPAKAKVYSNPPKTTIVVSGLFMSIWNVPAAKTVTEALPLVVDTIRDEVLQFQPMQTNELTVAGGSALLLAGPGVEADDGDPSKADVAVFAVGGHVFMASVHGEHNDAERECQPMLDVLHTARIP